jgi:hypothetical protein
MIDPADADLLDAPGIGLRPVSELVDATMNRIICRAIGRKVRAAMTREARQAGWPGFRA